MQATALGFGVGLSRAATRRMPEPAVEEPGDGEGGEEESGE
jgi:hypothetical protein